MNFPGWVAASGQFSLSPEEQELFANSLLVRLQCLQIVHFLRAEFFLSLIEHGRLLLRRTDTYEDDIEEATYPELNRVESSHADQQIEEILPSRKDRDAVFASQRIARSLSFVHCWHEGDPSCQKMWDRYGDKGRGVCVQSNTHALQASLGTPPVHLDCEVGRCTYWTDAQALPEMISSFPAFRKRRKYDDEQEIRLLARIKHDHTPVDSEGHIVVPPQFEPLPIDLNVLVSGIVLGPMMDGNLKRAVHEATLRRLGEDMIIREA